MKIQKFLYRKVPAFYLKLSSARMTFYMLIGKKKKSIEIITEHLTWNKK
jgi:hypothetical protein